MKKAAGPSILCAVILLAVAVIAEAQQPKKVYRIGYLAVLDPATDSARAEAIRMALRELGYIEGQRAYTKSRGTKINLLHNFLLAIAAPSCSLAQAICGDNVISARRCRRTCQRYGCGA